MLQRALNREVYFDVNSSLNSISTFKEAVKKINNRDVDNILSKKFKPFSSHILDIYFEKLSFTSKKNFSFRNNS